MFILEVQERMNKISLTVYIIGEVKTGKSHLAMLGLSGMGEDTVMIDATPSGHARIAAMNVYGKKFEDRYYHVEEDKSAIMSAIENVNLVSEENGIKTICIDESKNLRGAFAKPVLDSINKERGKGKELKTIYPVTRWADVYQDVDKLFRDYDGLYNFIITSGLKDKRGYDKESKTSYVTGQKEGDGLKTLKTSADIGLQVVMNNKDRVRTVKVLVNRLLDAAGEGWVAEVKNIGELMDKVIENSKFDKEMFIV